MSEQLTSDEIRLMREALDLAARGRGDVEPNPMVGCIIHRDGRVIGRGYHRGFGLPHAEPDALANCSEVPRGASAVVTLEPCCHTNKKTPPCVPALLAAGIKRIAVGQIDPNPAVCGQGITQLRDAGVQVITGVLESDCAQLNAPFHTLTKLRRPYVTLKWAQSADGLMGGSGNTPRHISGPESNRLTHLLRTRCDAILVSVDTVICDNPSLTVRHVPVKRTPIRMVLDSRLRTPADARILQGDVETHIFTIASHPDPRPGAQVHLVAAQSGHVDFPAVLQFLGDRKCTHLLVEPGPRLAASLLQADQVDRLWIIRSPKALNETNGPVAPQIPWPATATRHLGEDLLTEHLNPRRCFSSRPSPEFSL